MAVLGVTIELTGKITDPLLGAEVKAAINSGLLELATIEGQAYVQDQLYPGHGMVTSDLHGSIHAALPGPYFAQFDAGHYRDGENLIYSYWVEGTSTLNAKSVFKGYKMFDKATKRLEANTNLWQKYVGEHIMRVFKLF